MQIVVPAFVALVVALMTHLFTSARDRNNRRREQRISYLVNAFRALAKVGNHPRLHEVAPELEQAVADIQLFGSQEQISLVQDFITALGTNGEATLDSLLLSLRTSLRQEVGASSVGGSMKWLKVHKR